MTKKAGKRTVRRQRPTAVAKALKWAIAIVVIVGLGYVLLENAGVAYDEEDIAVVNFSNLDASERRSALQAANRARCTCGCGMGLAQCVATDMTCPVRDRNIDSIRTMVREADRP
jgi:hypothetical protein